MTPDVSAEVCVIGGGPAGSTVASRLARLGHDVCLVERAVFPRPHIGESLPPGILPLLEVLGVRERAEQAGFLRPERAIVRWAPATDRIKSERGQPGFQVDRGRFDQILLEAAQAAGVRVLQPAAARRPAREGPRCWRIPLRRMDGISAVKAAFCVDASGRRFVSGGPKRRCSPPTIALCGYWQNARVDGPETRIEAGEEAWYWGAPLPDGTINATVFLDAAGGATRRADLEALYRTLLRDSTLLRGCLDGELGVPVSACGATSYLDEAAVGEDFIKVGEAGFAVDPLSSQGVLMAIQSGLQASIVVHTLQTAPRHAGAALQFYRDRLCRTSARHAALAARCYAEHERHRARPFWRARAAGARSRSQPHRQSAAAAPGLLTRMRVSPATRLVDTPCVVGDLIAPQGALEHPALEEPVVYLNGIAVAPLLERVRSGMTLWEIVQSWPLDRSLPFRLTLASWLAERGILVPVDRGPPGGTRPCGRCDADSWAAVPRRRGTEPALAEE